MILRKKNPFLLLVFILMISILTGCGFINDRHRTKKEAQDIAEKLIGEEVTYIETKIDEDEKRQIFIFKDSRENEFAIISTLRQPNIDGASFGSYYCHVSNSYAAGVLVSNKDKVMDILKSYELDEYLNSPRAFSTDIYSGDGVVAPAIDLRVPLGTYEENKDILERVAAAGAEIDALLALHYNTDIIHTGHKKGFYYDEYSTGTGILLAYEDERINAEGHTYYNFDIAHFVCSLSEDNRWTAENLYEHMKSQLKMFD